MKMLVAVAESARQGEVIRILEGLGVQGYSVIPSVFGAGETGAHLGTRAFPGENVMILALVPAEAVGRIEAGLAAFSSGLRSREGFRVLALDADILV